MVNKSYLDNRSAIIKKLGLTPDNNQAATAICKILRDNKDLKDFLLANRPEFRRLIYGYLKQKLNMKFRVYPYWYLMGLKRPGVN